MVFDLNMSDIAEIGGIYVFFYTKLFKCYQKSFNNGFGCRLSFGYVGRKFEPVFYKACILAKR